LSAVLRLNVSNTVYVIYEEVVPSTEGSGDAKEGEPIDAQTEEQKTNTGIDRK